MTEAGISPRQATHFLACQKVSKEHGPIVCVPALRSGQTCVTQFRLWCRPTRCAARRFAQTNGGKSEDDAGVSCGTPAHSLNRVPQAQPHGGSGQPARFVTKLAHRLSFALRYGYQFDREAIWLLVSGIAPCAHACDGGLAGRVVAPQSATTSLSNLRPFV